MAMQRANPTRTRHPTRSRAGFPTRFRAGFTLLEMLLALAILGGSLAVLSQIAATGTEAARESRDLAMARLLCQSKLSEILLQNITPVAVPPTPAEVFDSGSLTPFTYSVEVQPGPLEGLLAIRVVVQATNLDGGPPLATYSLTRWMIDPAIGLEEAEMEEQAMRDAAQSGETL
jgi:prepilin-type N-terminal cleavage/methylation domain-containing protein